MPLKLPNLPCGCAVSTNRGRGGRGRPDVFIVSKDRRVCRHGKVWTMKWVEVCDVTGLEQKKCTLSPGHRVSDNPECKDHP